jgi:hypothetical protein
LFNDTSDKELVAVASAHQQRQQQVCLVFGFVCVQLQFA